MSPGAIILQRWLEWLDSHDGRLFRRSKGGEETEYDIAALVPNPPGQAIFTIGDLREVVRQLMKGTSLNEPESRNNLTESD